MRNFKLFKNGFSFIEILVVIAIIGVLFGVTTVTYTNVSKGSRDAKRKTDLENIRVALEQYRSNNSSYPAALNSLVTPVIYMQAVPSDPSTGNQYSYTPSCNGNTCYSYTMTATLEYPSGTTYTVTPYGSTSATPTPTQSPGGPGGGSCFASGAACSLNTDCCSSICTKNICN